MVSPIVSGTVSTAFFVGNAGRAQPLEATAYGSTTTPVNAAGVSAPIPDPAKTKAENTPIADTAQNTLGKLNASMQAWDTGVQFEVDEDSQLLVTKLVDRSTGDVIRQVPSEATLKVARMISEMRGSTINTHA